MNEIHRFWNTGTRFAAFAAIFMLAGSFAGCGVTDAIDTGNSAEQQTRILEDVSPAEAHTLIQANAGNQDFVILDVRTLLEYLAGHIQDAVNLDFYSASFRDELDLRDKDLTYLIYCRSGNRNGQALIIMDDLGFMEVYNLTGGIVQWQDEGFPIVTLF